MDSELQVGSHQCGAEGQNPFAEAGVHAAFDAGHASVDAAGLLGCEHTLLGHVELLVNQNLQVLLLKAALNPFSIQPAFVLWIALTQVQDIALGLVQHHEVCTGPLLKPIQVSLDGIPSLQHVYFTYDKTHNLHFFFILPSHHT